MKRRLWQKRVLLLLLILSFACPAVADTPTMRLFYDTSELDTAFVRGGELVTNLNYPNPKGVIARYTGVDLGENPLAVKCRVRYYGGGAVALVAAPEGEWSLMGITARSIHLVFTSDGYYLGFYEDGILTDVLTGGYTLDITGAKEYTVGFEISGSTITLLLPTGKKVKKKDERVKTCNGPRIIFEHYLTAEDVAEGNMPAIAYLYAKGKSLPALEDEFRYRMDGPLGIAPTGHAYVQFRNEDD